MKVVVSKSYKLSIEAKEASNIIESDFEIGKEHYVSVGVDAAIIKNIGGNFEYIELQSATNDGWTDFNKYGLMI